MFILAGGLLPLCLLGLTPLSFSALMLQGAISGLLFCGLVVLLWYIIKYTRLRGNSVYQRVINHSVLLGSLLLVWQGSEHFILYLLLKEQVFQEVVLLIPCKLVGGLLLFLLVIQYYSRTVSVTTEEVIEEEESQPSETTERVTNNEQLPNEPDQIKEIVSPQGKITVKSGSNIHLIPLQELMYIQAEGDYVVLYTATARHIKEETMKHLESQLPPSFLRIHRSCIVNTEKISRIELYEKQQYLITLKTGQQVRASLNGYKLLKERLKL
jgi:hypothetical protein